MPGFVELSAGVANLGLSAGVNIGGLSVGVSVGVGVRQQFRTIPVPNTNFTLYSLAIRAPNQGFGLLSGYTFPLSPANIRKEFNALTNFYDVAGTPQTYGVQRIVDVYGNSPIIYIIEGTTGWKRHSTDGFALTGLQSIEALISIINQFARLTQEIISSQSGQDLYTLEFYDYFRGDFWQVVPLGPQIVRQSRTRPLFVDYMFRLLGVQDLTQPVAINDPLAGAFTTPPSQEASDIKEWNSVLPSNYGDVTIQNIGLRNPDTGQVFP